MSVPNEIRQQRVANGSRRKRDLAAVGGDIQASPLRIRVEGWIAQNLPGEDFHTVNAVEFHLKKQGHAITAASVREGLRERGWLREQNS